MLAVVVGLQLVVAVPPQAPEELVAVGMQTFLVRGLTERQIRAAVVVALHTHPEATAALVGLEL
jgi:hypothetical protein